MRLATLQDVMFGYDDVPCLEDANVEINSGEFIAVTGPNGAAKSTLLKLTLGLLQPWRGKAELSSHNKDGNKLAIGYVPQQIASFNGGFPSNVQEFVLSGRYGAGSWWRRMGRKDLEAVERALLHTDTLNLRNRKIGELSGGQKQRICLARALAMSPDLYVLDEPTTGMDQESRERFYDLMRNEVRAMGKTVVMVTHNLTEVERDLDRVVTLVRKEESGWKCCTTTSCSGHFVPAG
ncbi:metal ABC transporter ATP-binding protein [Cohnella thailandensis]|uniref:Metal ABC transporter ATP-binding protein n=1 Tax=Cohnella thailandensis TaxID=557557 RepID=A0A841SN09_9BACL|nr:metal ABC transporter ATP-binding protein [Cohnella thailandensis]MBB6633334.1 metal ABC transporter ATP-binding protein [Cohnella thailandensis]MBP1977324.1 zinc transport system ATP-binding protein [Cohnella thailandensis]